MSEDDVPPSHRAEIASLNAPVLVCSPGRGSTCIALPHGAGEPITRRDNGDETLAEIGRSCTERLDDFEASSMTTPLILQIQAAARDSQSSVTDALRKAKIACIKLELTEFGNWVDLELNGYIGKKGDEFPEYRKLHGTPQAFNPYRGWVPISFASPSKRESGQLPISQ